MMMKEASSSRIECKSHTLYMTKMAKIDTLFMTKTVEKYSMIVPDRRRRKLKQMKAVIPFPVWSAEGPVPHDGVLPFFRVQSNTSFLS